MSLVVFEKQGSIGYLTLNNPDNLNAMTEAMGDAIAEKIAELKQHSELRVIIIKGAGRAFSAGGDFKFILDHTEKNREQNQKEMVEFYSKFLSLRNIEIPTIAMLNGPAIGAGFLIALACDLRYAVNGAKMGANFAKIGLSSGMGGLYWLTQLAGPAVAADLLLSGRTLLADEAFELKLVNGVFPAESLENKVNEIAQQIAVNAPLPLKIMKKGIQKAPLATLEEILQYESQGQALCFETEDLKEGIAAIKEKRNPEFRGK